MARLCARAERHAPPPLPLAAPAGAGGIVCDSCDCGLFFERRKLWHELSAVRALAQAGLELLS